MKLPLWPESLVAQIHARVQAAKSKIIVLDDDPTGTQTVHDIPVYTDWSLDTIRHLFADPSKLIYILTNSRSLIASKAEQVAHEITTALNQVSLESGIGFTLISRSDSTLRGHFPAEVDALAKALGKPTDAYVLIPAFFEGGRETIDDVHYLHQGDVYTPVNETPFAKDAVFGYQNANLKAWTEEKTKDRVKASEVLSISLETLRQGGPERVFNQLMASDSKVIVVNAADYRDLEVASLGLIKAEAAGKTYLYRTAASFVLTRAGMTKRSLLSLAEFDLSSKNGGLIIVGSHVPLSTVQLEHVLNHTDSYPIELKVPDLLEPAMAKDLLARALKDTNKVLSEGRDVIIFTSRELIKRESAEANLAISSAVSQSLVSLLKNLTTRPKYLIAKGGITSSDLATQGLGVKKAIVKGQILAGIPVWSLGKEAKFPGLDYIVFPGNVGNANSLTEIIVNLKHEPNNS